MSTNREEYKRELSRIKSEIKRLQRSGYIFNSIKFDLPERVTAKRLEAIRAVTPNELRKMAVNGKNIDEMRMELEAAKQQLPETSMENEVTLPSTKEASDLSSFFIDKFFDTLEELPPGLRDIFRPIFEEFYTEHGGEEFYRTYMAAGGADSIYETIKAMHYDTYHAAEEFKAELAERFADRKRDIIDAMTDMEDYGEI